jgi:hypothetical protein
VYVAYCSKPCGIIRAPKFSDERKVKGGPSGWGK